MFANINGKEIPEYCGKPYIEIFDNSPNFSEFPQYEKYKELGSFEIYGAEYKIYSAYDCIESGNIWRKIHRCRTNKRILEYYQKEYDFIKGKRLFNYCHLIAHQFLKEKLDDKNLIIGTRYMNERGMMHFESIVAECLKNKNNVNHVLYRVTPIFNDGEQLARGVQMEAYSVEDHGKKICFNVFIYNVQPGVSIDYKDGTSEQDNEWCKNIFSKKIYTDEEKGTQNYVLNTRVHKFHNPDCSLVDQIYDKNRIIFKWPKQYLIDNHYKACKNCNP